MTSKITLLDFWAEWCFPCQQMKPVIEELEKELDGKVKVEKINIDNASDKAAQYGVMSIPTYIVMKNGKEIGRKVGVISKADLLALIK